MKKPLNSEKQIKPQITVDRIEGNKVILAGWGYFPKKVIIVERGISREYELKKTRKGNYLLL